MLGPFYTRSNGGRNQEMASRVVNLGVVAFALIFSLLAAPLNAAQMGSHKYSDFKKPTSCKGCHREIYQEWSKSMMAHAFVHEWDQAEYFKLALVQAGQLPKVAGVKAGCIACHAPLAFLSGDIPPKMAKAGTRANEGVTCEICHSITGSTEKEPYNFSYTIQPGNTKQGPRKDAKPRGHKVVYSKFLRSPELCATCHDEQSPYGQWVKSTYREWKAGPYAKEGVRCQDCHMYRYKGKAAGGAKVRGDVAHHVFHGSHSPSKVAGAVDVALYIKSRRVQPGRTLKLTVQLFNGKVGHMIPSGSSEERMLWLEVWAIDKNGKSYHLPVTPKGFKGEEYTIADSKALAYQAMGEIMGRKGFKGLARDGAVPYGARIFRRPFFDPQGRMTICQWYTADNTLVDYRIGPRETKIENYTWEVPEDLPKGKLTIKANLFYAQVPSSVGKFLGLPEEEYRPMLVNSASAVVTVE